MPGFGRFSKHNKYSPRHRRGDTLPVPQGREPQVVVEESAAQQPSPAASEAQQQLSETANVWALKPATVGFQELKMKPAIPAAFFTRPVEDHSATNSKLGNRKRKGLFVQFEEQVHVALVPEREDYKEIRHDVWHTRLSFDKFRFPIDVTADRLRQLNRRSFYKRKTTVTPRHVLVCLDQRESADIEKFAELTKARSYDVHKTAPRYHEDQLKKVPAKSAMKSETVRWVTYDDDVKLPYTCKVSYNDVKHTCPTRPHNLPADVSGLFGSLPEYFNSYREATSKFEKKEAPYETLDEDWELQNFRLSDTWIKVVLKGMIGGPYPPKKPMRSCPEPPKPHKPREAPQTWQPSGLGLWISNLGKFVLGGPCT